MKLNEKPIPPGIKAIRAELLEVRKAIMGVLSGAVRYGLGDRGERPRPPMLSELAERERSLQHARDVIDGVHVEIPKPPAASREPIPKKPVHEKPVTVIVDGTRLENAKVVSIRIHRKGMGSRTIDHSEIGDRWTIRISTKKAKKP